MVAYPSAEKSRWKIPLYATIVTPWTISGRYMIGLCEELVTVHILCEYVSIGGTFASFFVENWHRFSHTWFIFLCISSKYIPIIFLNTYCCIQNDNKVLSFMSPIIWHLHDIVDYNLFSQKINRHRCLLFSLFLRSRTAHQEFHQVHESWNMEDPPVPVPLTYKLLFKYCTLSLFSSR